MIVRAGYHTGIRGLVDTHCDSHSSCYVKRPQNGLVSAAGLQFADRSKDVTAPAEYLALGSSGILSK